MSAQQVTEHVYLIQSEDVNVYLIVQPESLTLVDTGFPGAMADIDEAVRSLGRSPGDIGDVLVTHCHLDHAGALAEITRATGASAWMHGCDAEMVRAGESFRPYEVAPGPENQAFVDEVISQAPTTFEPAVVDHEVAAGEVIPVAGGIQAIWTPGHTLGHLVFFWPGDGGVLFLGDVAKNVHGLVPSPIYEDLSRGLESLRELGNYHFETACFAHGAPIIGGAAEVLKKRWQ
ncbi:MAG: MBL fold metallo-hydrolase [Actinobacteria bacterium]|nr:MBL fold metallo-hydrolase [Actinomycetota bacterium]